MQARKKALQALFKMAGRGGLEPPPAVPETAVLPIRRSPNFTKELYTNDATLSN